MRRTSILLLRLFRKWVVPTRLKKESENNNALHVEENLPWMNDMVIDFASSDMFGDSVISILS